jgi:hypothetical protein
MTHEILLHSDFGPSQSDGSEAYAFRVSTIDPYQKGLKRVSPD